MKLSYICEAGSPEYKQRAKIIEGLGDLYFNIHEGTRHTRVSLYSLDKLQELMDAYQNAMQSGRNLRPLSADTLLGAAFVGAAMVPGDVDPTNIHIQLSRPYQGRGIGGMLYEIAIELATKDGRGVMLSGARGDGTSSNDAYRTWNHFLKNRTNIIPIPIDKYVQTHNIKTEKYKDIDEQSIAKNLLTRIDPGDDDVGAWDRGVRERGDGRTNTFERSFYDRDEIPAKVLDRLKESFPTAFHVYMRNLYTIPQLQQAGRLSEISDDNELSEYLLSKLKPVAAPVRQSNHQLR